MWRRCERTPASPFIAETANAIEVLGAAANTRTCVSESSDKAAEIAEIGRIYFSDGTGDANH